MKNLNEKTCKKVSGGSVPIKKKKTLIIIDQVIPSTPLKVINTNY